MIMIIMMSSLLAALRSMSSASVGIDNDIDDDDSMNYWFHYPTWSKTADYEILKVNGLMMTITVQW